ncbi:hypothetical protein niasHT_020200 [Heterodera trifolii]|uniref:Polymerase nucleotidyl transferase domain-containing protein n=1 Tax=Heterodera trifolii TaxID=157864 RepID=A0ABD2K497_9BILA
MRWQIRVKSDAQRSERLMADLAMFSDYLWGIRRMTTSIKLRKEIEQQIEHFWLLLRIAYDGFSMLKRGDIEQQKLSQMSFIQANIISEFCDELKLKELFAAFFRSPCVEKVFMLEQASIIFEIKQRLEAIEQLEKVGGKVDKTTKSEEKAKLIGKVEEILDKSVRMGESHGKLANLLKDTLNYYDGISPIFYRTEIDEKQLKWHILTKYLALFSVLNGSENEKSGNKQINGKALEKLKTFLDKFIGQKLLASQSSAAEVHSKEELDGQTMNVLHSVRSIVDEWSNKRGARLLLTGSHLLGTNTFGSDIDLICVVPGKRIKQSDFFGDEQTECTANKCSRDQLKTDEEQSKPMALYCILCQVLLCGGRYGKRSFIMEENDRLLANLRKMGIE